MNIKIKKLTLFHFKGAEKQEVNFTTTTDILGANASGKTRLFDAFTWLLFGKDSEDKKDFNIKSLDKNNEPLHRVDHSVTGILAVDGMDTKLERIYKEKWIKKRGEETPEFNGHETLFFVNGVPYQATDYQEKVEDILSESLFKQLTNPLYFNSMKWMDRRAMLFEIAGKITDHDVIASNSDLKKFYELITGKTLDEFKRELSAKKKLLKDSISNIPARIDEVARAIVIDPDYASLNSDISKLNTRMSEIDILINSEAAKFNAANQENQRKQNRIYEIQRQIKELQFEDLSKVEESVHGLKIKKTHLGSQIIQLQSDIAGLKDRIEGKKHQKEALEKENDSLRNDWTKANESALIFKENEFNCPACNRPFETSDIEAKKEELTAQFNRSKSVQLEVITNVGKKNAVEIAKITEDITRLALQITGHSQNISKYKEDEAAIIIPEKPTITPNPQIKVLQDELIITNNLMVAVVSPDNSELISEKSLITTSLDILKKQLNIKDENARHRARKQELIDSEKSLSQQIADVEKQEFQCEAFTRAKINMIEDKVNSMFTLVKFKMFNTLINGGTEETCEALIEGVPYQDANNAAKIQGGLDIIRTLSKHYDVYAPVFIDNRESVTDIPEMDCQVISLIVDPSATSLVVKNYSDIPETLTFKN